MLSKNLKYGNINANASFPEEKGIPTSLTIMHIVSLFYTFIHPSGRKYINRTLLKYEE
jgi:hypothetical protein